MKKSSLILMFVLLFAAGVAAGVAATKYVERGGFWQKAILVMTDARCKECRTDQIVDALKRMFPTRQKIKVIDYSTSKDLYKAEGISKLPVALLPKDIKEDKGYEQVKRFARNGKDYIILPTGGDFDPTAEICDNNVDDNNNGLIDCNDPTCKSKWMCMEKREKPSIDLFVMSYCPYGLQILKGFMPVWDAFGNKIDAHVRFVDYAMHGEKEVKENLKQYCIQNLNKDSYKKYLYCFLEDGNQKGDCDEKAGVDKKALETCIKDTDTKFGVTASLNNKEKWMGNFPPFAPDAEMAKRFEVKGSPTVIINDVVADDIGRSPNSLKEAICKGFVNPPEECKKEMDKNSPAPGFGLKKSQEGGKGGSGGSCG